MTSAVRQKNILRKALVLVSLARKQRASWLFRRGQRQSTPSFTAKSYFRWKFIALARIEASFPDRTKQRKRRTRLAPKIIGVPFYRVLFRSRGLFPPSPVTTTPPPHHPCRFLSGTAIRLRKLTIVKCTYGSADLFPRGLSKRRNLDIYRSFPALR